jgi:branched-chain amino acid transport system ATP-binding protein
MSGLQPRAPHLKDRQEQGSAAGQPAHSLVLSDIYAGYGRAQVLRGITVEVPRGAIVALLGPNGAGKTTLLRVASGLLKATAGTVVVDSRDVTQASPASRARAGLCLIPEGRGIFRSLSVRENLRLQVPPWLRDNQLDRVLEMFPVLRKRLSQTAGTMSGGEQQMLALARAYLADPDVVLLDEVSMGLAPKVVDAIFDVLRRLADTGVSMLLVEQYVARALEMADGVVLLNKGEVAFSGPSSALEESEVLGGYLAG